MLNELQKQQQSNKSGSNFNWSDLKIDKTQFLDKTPNRSSIQKQQNSPFEHKEISARSTAIKNGSKRAALDFDSLMKSSLSAAVQSKYRESMSTGRLSVMSMSSAKRSDQKMDDVWENQNQCNFSVSQKNMTFSSEDFAPAEEMASRLAEDERMHDMEYAAIPRMQGRETYTVENESNWEDSAMRRQPEMSFGKYASKFNASNIRDIYSKKSPPPRENREAFVELSTNEQTSDFDTSSRLDSIRLEKFISKSFLTFINLSLKRF